MLTVFHTADWHLGQSFCGFDRDYEHRCFLDWLLQQLQSQQPDALIIAGDLFDTINPSAVAQRRFYSFLATAHSCVPRLQIVLTAGNHDAGARLEAPAAVLNSLNTVVVGRVAQDDQGYIDLQRFLVPLNDADGKVQAIVMAVPFLRPSDVPLLDGADDPYLDGIRELYQKVTTAAVRLRSEQYPDTALIAMGHCHLHGGEESRDSERRLVVGGAEAITADTFDKQIAYVALGHLHRSQHFDNGRIRYSGSPIPLSFAETDYRHQLLKLTFQQTECLACEEIPIPRSAMLLRVPDAEATAIDDVLARLESLELDDCLPPEQYPFLEVRVREDGPDPSRRRRIEQALEGKPVRLASIKLEHADRKTTADQAAALRHVDLKTISPETIFKDAWQEKYGNDPESSVMDAFREILLQEARSA
ncbi:MAG: exonuclease SbcCD subunit D C-terminal domain-containing protein [Planctomycetaceae bacterium]